MPSTSTMLTETGAFSPGTIQGRSCSVRADIEKIFTPLQCKHHCQHSLVGFFIKKRCYDCSTADAYPLSLDLNQID